MTGAAILALGAAFCFALALILNFFRDPERKVPAEQHAMVSPADGTVSDITELDHCPPLRGPGRAPRMRTPASCPTWQARPS